MKRLYHSIEIKFECQEDCAKCCMLSDGYVFLSGTEAQGIAKELDMSENDFLQYFTRIIDEQLCLLDGEDEHCVFLENNKCNIYDARPAQCRTYPFWPENLKSKSRWQLTCKECPGIGKGKKYTPQEIDRILNMK